MKTEYKENLSALLNAHKVKKGEISEVRKKNIDTREQFLVSFEQLAKSDIEPVMRKFAEEIKPYGHYVHVKYAPADRQQQGGTAAHITLSLYMDSEVVKSGQYPYISFYAHEFSQKISITVSTMRPNSGGMTSKVKDDLELHHLNAEFIEQQIMNGISQILTNKY